MQDASSPSSESLAPSASTTPEPSATTPTRREYKLVYGAKYKGDEPELVGKTAILRVYSDRCEAQFDDQGTPYSHGWHTFPLETFEGVEAGDVQDEEDGPPPQDPGDEQPGLAINDVAASHQREASFDRGQFVASPYPPTRYRGMDLPPERGVVADLATALDRLERRLQRAVIVAAEIRDILRVLMWSACGCLCIGAIYVVFKGLSG